MIQNKERIAKMMASCGICSRRTAEKYIAQGRVKVNGQVLETPAFLVDDKDKITLDDKPLKKIEQPQLWLYHKPIGQLTTHDDPAGRPTVFQALPKALGHVISVGRLDFNSEGLLLLTNCGTWAHYLESPQTKIPRTYKVRVFGDIPADMAERLAKGMTVQGVHYGKCQMTIDKQTGKNAWLRLTLCEGKNREIRRLMTALGLKVNRLIRQSYGPFILGNLRVGEVKPAPAQLVQQVFACVS